MVKTVTEGNSTPQPSPEEQQDVAATSAQAALFDRLKKQQVVDIGRWTRDELYEDEH
jgi:hypothetical protein